MTQNQHPNTVLFENQSSPPLLPVCEHIAGTPRFLEKAFALQESLTAQFDVTIDLEDGSPTTGLLAHTKSLIETVQKFAKAESRFGLRLPHHSTAEWQDLLALSFEQLGEQLLYITLPKIQSAKELESIATQIAAQENKLKKTRAIPFHVLIETYEALADIDAIAAHPRVEVLDFGIMDFISEHLGGIPDNCMRSPGQFEHVLIRKAKTTITEAAYRHGVIASHNVTTAYNDIEQTFEDAKHARERFGFSRMWSIHPAQIEPIVRAMQPEMKNITVSEAIVTAGFNAGWSPIAVDGILHDRASFRYHWQLCKRAKAFGMDLSPEFTELFF